MDVLTLTGWAQTGGVVPVASLGTLALEIPDETGRVKYTLTIGRRATKRLRRDKQPLDERSESRQNNDS